jgi:hypothetical protein
MEVIEHKLVIGHRISRLSRKKEDTHLKGTKPSGKKSTNCSKLGSSGQ